MEVKIIKDEKKEIEIEIGSLTIAELLRVYLNKNGAEIVAWRREHPTENPILHIEADNPKKILNKTIAQIEKEINSLVENFKKLK